MSHDRADFDNPTRTLGDRLARFLHPENFDGGEVFEWDSDTIEIVDSLVLESLTPGAGGADTPPTTAGRTASATLTIAGRTVSYFASPSVAGAGFYVRVNVPGEEWPSEWVDARDAVDAIESAISGRWGFDA